MAKKGIAPVTVAALSEPKINAPVDKEDVKTAKKPAPKALAALFGKKPQKKAKVKAL